MKKVHVIPLKNGLWRAVFMSDHRYEWWNRAYGEWFKRKGNRLAISPEMWVE